MIIKEYIKVNFFIRGYMFKPLKNKNYDENERSILINSLFTNEDYIIINIRTTRKRLLSTRLICSQTIQGIFRNAKIKT